jgi:hypothetical protein
VQFTYCVSYSCSDRIVAVAAECQVQQSVLGTPSNVTDLNSAYLLQANEHAAAEKQLATHAPTVPIAGNAIQLRAAPMVSQVENAVAKASRRQCTFCLCARFVVSRDQHHLTCT